MKCPYRHISVPSTWSGRVTMANRQSGSQGSRKRNKRRGSVGPRFDDHDSDQRGYTNICLNWNFTECTQENCARQHIYASTAGEATRVKPAAWTAPTSHNLRIDYPAQSMK